MKLAAVAISLVMMSALVGGGPLHSVVEHDHGTLGGGLEIAWETLHAGLSHQFTDMLAVLPVLFATALAVLVLVIPRTVLAPAHAPEELRRGTAKYRKFR